MYNREGEDVQDAARQREKLVVDEAMARKKQSRTRIYLDLSNIGV